MEKRIILAHADEELTDEQMALFAKDVDFIEVRIKAEEQKDWNRVDQLLKERQDQPNAIKGLRTKRYKELYSAWEKETNRELNMNMSIRDKEKLDRANQLINEKAEVQADGSLRISSEDWRGINRKINEKNIEKNKLFEDAIRGIAEEGKEQKMETFWRVRYQVDTKKKENTSDINPITSFDGKPKPEFLESGSIIQYSEYFNFSDEPVAYKKMQSFQTGEFTNALNSLLEKRNINSKENFMSEQQNTGERVFRPPVNAAEEVAKNEAFINMKHQRKVVIDGLTNGTLSCLPGEDGFADTQPAVNLVTGKYYHGANMLDLKDHQKKNGFPTAEYVTEHQIEKAKENYPELSIKQGEKGLSIHWEDKNDQTGAWEKKSVFLFNVAQTTNPEEMKMYAEQRQQEERQNYIDYKRKSYPGWEPQEPKQKGPGPVIECSSTEPEKYLGQYFAAVSIGGKFKVSEEQAAEFAQKMGSALDAKFKKLNAEGEYEEQDYPDIRNLSKISNAASAYCKDVIQLSRQQENKEQYKNQQEQTQSRGRSM
jgi:hypothetical protein